MIYMEEVNKVVQKLIDREYRISFAESCTGGLCCAELVGVADASKVLDVSFTTYANEAKVNFIGVNADTIEKFGVVSEEVAKEMNMSIDKVREIMKIAQEPVSLETPIGEEEDSHLGDFIPDDAAPAPAEAASFTMLKEQLNNVLSTLTDREAKVLRLRFGLEDGRARTLEEVGFEFGLTRERIRQIEAKALRKLRHPSRSRKLKDYLE